MLLASAGCAQAQALPPPTSPAPEETAPPLAKAAGQEAWWHQAGDPVLSALVDQGLTADHGLACRIEALRRRDRKSTASSKTFGGSLKRLFDKGAATRDQAEREAQVERLADQRAALAERIVLSYIDLRRLQQISAMRAALLDQYKENAEIAEFRRQAGLVPAIDSALAHTQDNAARAELGYLGNQLGDAKAALAQLVGLQPDALAARVGDPAALPPALASASLASGDYDAHVEDLAHALDAAHRTAKDARAAYRDGAANLATLYVAEAAALSVDQALVDARAQRAAAVIRQWSARGKEWARADIDQPTTANATASDSESPDCD